MKRRRRGRRKYLPDDFKEMRRYWKLEEKSYIAHFGGLDLEEVATYRKTDYRPKEFVQVMCTYA